MRGRIGGWSGGGVIVAAALAWSCPSPTSSPPRETPPPQAPSTTKPVEAATCEERLRGIGQYLWGDPKTPVPAEFAPGLAVVEQEYEPSDDESGFSLGPEERRTLANAEEVEEFLGALRRRVGARGSDVGHPRDASGTEWPDRLGHGKGDSSDFCALTLEIGDVEHVLVVQFDRGTGRAVAAYAN